jgi:hypothetical protein
MNFQDPSLYTVTPREIGTPFVPPFAWQNFPRFTPFQAYGMQPFPTYGMQQFHPYWMQQSFPFAPIGTLPYANYGTQPFVPPSFAYGYGTQFQGMPYMLQGSNLPYSPVLPGWQKPLWY